jgi:aquaporin Z
MPETDTDKQRDLGAALSLCQHWPEYAMEAVQLGLFMVSASAFGVLLFHPALPIPQLVEPEWIRRGLMGLVMGLTAIAIIYSPFGQRSGAHLNPSVTLTYWRLGKVAGWDAAFYIVAQFAGGAAGTLFMSAVLGEVLGHPNVHYVTTHPGALGLGAAWMGEFTIAFVMMLAVLHVSNRPAIARYTGVVAACLVACFIFVESPLSGTSMNPARTSGSAIAAHLWTGWWIYFTAPPAAMLLAAEIHLRFGCGRPVYCAKLNHFTKHRCIFRCRHHEMVSDPTSRQDGQLQAPLLAAPVPQETLYFG